MNPSKTVVPILPLRYSSHRLIVTANGDVACEVFSGAIGIEGADQLQELIVRACNSHEALVKALQRAERVLNHVGAAAPGEIFGAWEEVRAALAAAEAA